MHYFSNKAFEKLLFPLHVNVYKGIEKAFVQIAAQCPGIVEHWCSLFDLVFATPTTEQVNIPAKLRGQSPPQFDIHIDIKEKDLKTLHKTQNYATRIIQHESSYAGKGSHLVVSTTSKTENHAFIVPLQLLMTHFEKKVLKNGSYQVYEHTLIRENPEKSTDFTRDGHLEGGASYIGITKRSWQRRYKEHRYACNRNSHLLFHRALRQELFTVKVYEHQVLRAGLSASQALHIEEVEVEKRTLSSIHQSGLNMIPGGESGIRFISAMAKKRQKLIHPDQKEFELEAVVDENLRQKGIEINKGYKNEKLAQLWRQNIKFRITAMTNRADRMSYKQISNARIWHASGWSEDKILRHINKMEESRRISLDQLLRLLTGKTYQSIPHVLIDVDDRSI